MWCYQNDFLVHIPYREAISLAASNEMPHRGLRFLEYNAASFGHQIPTLQSKFVASSSRVEV